MLIFPFPICGINLGHNFTSYKEKINALSLSMAGWDEAPALTWLWLQNIEKNAWVDGGSLVLWQGHRLTLLCILDCAAHLLPMPKEVETNFLNQTIKVFTKVSKKTKKEINQSIKPHRCNKRALYSWMCFPLLSSRSDWSSIGQERVLVRNTSSNPESCTPRAVPQSYSGGCWFLNLLQPLRHKDKGFSLSFPGITVSKANVLYQTLLQIFHQRRRQTFDRLSIYFSLGSSL